MGAGGTVESRVEFEIEGEWTRLAETVSDAVSSNACLAPVLLGQY